MTHDTSSVAQNAAEFRPEVDDVFARIAERYDLLCDLFSVYAHRIWKSHLARRIALLPGRRVLDVASGTGDIPLRVLRRAPHDDRQILVTDLCAEMLDVARRRVGTTDPRVTYMRLDAHRLDEIESSSVDVYSIAFGMKIMDREQVLAQARRVLKPGGAFFCLEAARIPWSLVHAAYLKYMNWCLPLIARIATSDPAAYDYLLRGIHDFPDQRAFCNQISSHGFADVRFTNLTFGIVALHEGRKL
jgi:ubiquinone/menaquinone biosynthesis methyltransferase